MQKSVHDRMTADKTEKTLMVKLTWNHFDGMVDLLPFASIIALKQPVNNEVAVISHYRALNIKSNIQKLNMRNQNEG